MPRDLPLGNGRLLLNFDKCYNLCDIYWPHVGQELRTAGDISHTGIWVDSQFAWLDAPEWEREMVYEKERLVTPDGIDSSRAFCYHWNISSEKWESVKKSKTPTLLLELLLVVDAGQAKRLRAHLEAARCCYNAMLGEALKRMRQMRADPNWQGARPIPRSHKQERSRAFSLLRQQYRFSEYDLHDYAKRARISWIADHLDSTMAQTLATRAYQAVNRVCVGKAKRVRFRSKGRGLDSVEGKRNDVGLRFVLDPNAGDGGFLIWNQEVIPAIINWLDPVVQHGLRHPIKYVRLVRRKASSPQAKGADCRGDRFFVQLILEGHAYQKPKHQAGSNTIGLDIGPSTLAIMPQEGKAQLLTFCEELAPNAAAKRRLQRKWSGRDAPAILRTTMRRDASRTTASTVCAGKRANATDRLDANMPKPSANWPPSARACTGN